MTVLAVDCAGRAASAALVRDGTTLAEASLPMTQGHAARLPPLIAEVLDTSGLSAGDIGLLAATIGPGGFTGIRVGLAAITGLSLATGAPMVGIDGFEAWAATVAGERPAGRPLIVLLDSRRGDFFARAFAPDSTPVGVPEIRAPDALPDWADGLALARPVALAGDGVGLLPAALRDTLGVPMAADRVSAAAVGRLAEAGVAEGRLAAGETTPAPLYLRQADAVRAPPPRHHVDDR